MYQVKTKAGASGGVICSVPGPEEAVQKAREMADLEGQSDIVIIDAEGETYDLASFEALFNLGRAEGYR